MSPTADSSAQQKGNGLVKNGGNGKVEWSKRPVKKAPSPKQEELKERRRRMFLRKVKEGREERRWENRGEDVWLPFT